MIEISITYILNSMGREETGRSLFTDASQPEGWDYKILFQQMEGLLTRYRRRGKVEIKIAQLENPLRLFFEVNLPDQTVLTRDDAYRLQQYRRAFDQEVQRSAPGSGRASFGTVGEHTRGVRRNTG